MVSAIQKYTKVKYIGYCNGHELMQMVIEQLLGMTDRDESSLAAESIEREFMVPAGNVELVLAGINHMQWILKAIDAKTGEDLLPRMYDVIEQTNVADFPGGYKASFEISKILKCVPTPADNHVFDYIWCIDKAYADAASLGPFPVESWFGGMDADAWGKVAATVTSKEEAETFAKQRRTGWYNTLIAHEMTYGAPAYFPAINTINNGAVENLSDDIIVEVPAIIGPDYCRPVNVGKLPDAVAAMCELHGRINNLVAEAAAEGDRTKALQSLILDPFVRSVYKAEALLEDILEYNKQYDTRF